MRTKGIIFGEVRIIKVKKFKQNLSENYSKSTKYTACKFAKLYSMEICKIFPGEHAPDPPRAFLVIQSASNLYGQKKKLEKNVEIMPSPFLVFRYATGHDLLVLA